MVVEQSQSSLPRHNQGNGILDYILICLGLQVQILPQASPGGSPENLSWSTYSTAMCSWAWWGKKRERKKPRAKVPPFLVKRLCSPAGAPLTAGSGYEEQEQSSSPNEEHVEVMAGPMGSLSGVSRPPEPPTVLHHHPPAMLANLIVAASCPTGARVKSFGGSLIMLDRIH